MAGFMRRNPGFSFRTPEAVSTASSRVSEKDIRGWYDTTEYWLTENELREILDDPTRVFNGDETSFYLHPKTKEVIARIGSRNVYEVEQADGKKNITVMFAFGASGVIVTPHVILPGQRIRTEVAQSFPADWGLGLSENGWMDVRNFREFIRKIFYPFLVRAGVKFPVILFVDGHVSHKALEVADLCQSLGIVLICLYPNTTHITQPADVAVFKPLKSEWKRLVEEWRYEHQGCILGLPHFGTVLSKAVESGITVQTIQNGFRACGLYPFDQNAVDYSKCLAKATSIEPEATVLETDLDLANTPEVTDSPVNEDEYELPTLQSDSPEQSVKISMDRIVEAYDLIGSQTIARIEGDVNLLTREERVIRYFYREFVRPYISFQDLSLAEETRAVSSDQVLEATHVSPHVSSVDHTFASLSPMHIDINCCEVIYAEDIRTPLEIITTEPTEASLPEPGADNSKFGLICKFKNFLVKKHISLQPTMSMKT